MSTSHSKPSFPERLTRRLRTTAWKVPVTSILLAQFALWSVRVEGANVYWDTDGNSGNNTTSGSGLGGSGTWDNSTPNWWNLTSNGLWVDGSDTAVFSGTGGTVTLGTTPTVGGLTFNSNGYLLTGDTVMFTPGGGAPTPVVQVNGIGNRAVIESALLALDGFTKGGNGNLVLTNNGNYIAGDIAIRSGALVVNDTSIFSNGTTAISVTGVAATGNFSGGSLVLAGPTIGYGLTLDRDLTITGRGTNVVNNTGGLVSVGNNTLMRNLTMGTGASESRAWATHGTTTIYGNVYLGAGGASLFQGNGNWTISGIISGPDTVNDRLIKAGQIIGTTMWLQNPENNFGSNVRIDSGTVRVADVGALGRNMHTAAVELNGGSLEVRTDNAASFFNRNLSLRASGAIFAGREIGGDGLNQTLTLGGLIFSTNSGQTYTFNSRNGYAITLGTGGTATLLSGNATAMNNNGNNLLTLNSSFSMTDGTSRTNTLGGNGDWLITGNFLSPSGGNHVWNKSGTGMMTILGTAGTMTGSFNITGTVAATSIDTFNANGNGALQLNNGALVYGGMGETRTKLLNLLGTTGAGVIQANQPSGGSPLIFTGKPVAVGGAGTKVFYLGGNSDPSIVNQIGGVVSSNSAANITSLSKIGSNTWLYSPESSTYVSGGTASWVSGGAANSNTFVVNNIAGTIAVGQAVTGTNIPAGTVVTAFNPGTNTVSVSNNITTALAAGTLTFGGTSNFTGIVTVAGGTLQIRPTAIDGNGSDVINDLSGVTFNVDALNGNHWAGGTFEYQGFAGGSAETVGPLNPAAGQGNVKVTAAPGSSASLTFAGIGSNATTTAATSAATTVTVASTSGLAPGMVVSWPGSSGTITVAAITNGTQFTISSSQTIASGTALTFSRPVGSLLNIDPGTDGAVNFGADTGANGILGGYVTFGPNRTDFAASVGAGENVSALTGQAELPVSGGSATENYQSTGTPAAPLAAQSMNSLKMSGEQTLTLAGIQTITSGGILFDNSNGPATITHNGTVTNTLGANGSEVILMSNGSTPSNALTVNARISGAAGSLTKGGAGLVVLGVANLYTGTTTINEGMIRLTGTGTIGNGANLTMRQGTTLDLNGISLVSTSSSAVNVLNGPGLILNTAGSGTATFQAAGGNFTGLIDQTSGGKIAFIKSGTGTLAMTQAHTYTGSTTISGGNLDVTTLANIGVKSGIGIGDATSDATNAASLIFNGGSLRYIGVNTNGAVSATQTPSVSIDRLFTLAGNGRIDSFGSYGHISQTRAANHATLIFNNTADLPFSGTGVRTFTLGGDSTGDNEIRIRLRNNPNANEALSFTKVDAGLWILNPASSNTYTGTTTVSGGMLQVASEGDSIQGLSANSPLVLNGGVLQTYGSFTRSLAAPVAGAGTVQIPGGISGFASSMPDGLVVTINGGDLTWGSANFNPSQLVLGSGTALGTTEITNNIDFGTGARIITVNNNGNTGAMVTAGILSGVLSGGASVTKGGSGVLILGNANTYTGSTTVTGGNLILSSIGNATGTISSSLGASGGALIYSPADADLYALNYVGPGETASRPITFQSTAAHTANRTYRIDSSGTGPLVLNGAFTNTVAGNAAGRILTMELRGANTDLNQMNMVLTNSTAASNPDILAVQKTDGGVWVLNPASPNTFTGNLTIAAGTLGLTSNGIGSAGAVIFSNGAIFGYGGDLTITRPVTLANNTTAVFTGSNSITINSTITKAAGNNDQTIVNNLEGSALLTINGNFINLETTNSRTINIRGTNSIQWNGLIPNSTGAGTTSWNVALHPDATLIMGGTGANTYTGTTTLTNGNLQLSKVGALGTTGIFAFNGGTLSTTVSGGLVGASAIPNPVQINASPPRVAGSESIQFSGVVALGASRNFENALTSGQLILSGGITNTAASTLTIYGPGNTLISGAYNAGTGASNLTMSGTGTLNLTGTNTVTGALTVNRSTVRLSGTSGGTWNAGTVTLTAGGTLTLDNGGGENAAGRLNNAGAMAANGGTLNLIGDADGTTEMIGALTLNTATSFFNMSGAGSNTLNFASVALGNSGGSLDLSGISNLGTTNKVIFGGTLPTGFVFNNVAPRVFIGGNDFATYDATNGVRTFTAYNNSNDLGAAAATDTLNLTANSSISGAKTINALKINGTGLTVGGGSGNILTLAGAALLNTGGNNTITVPALAFGANAGFIQVATGTTLSMDGAFTGTGGLSKALNGTLLINSPSYLSGVQSVLAGTLKLNAGLNTLFPNQQLMVNMGATLDLNGNVQYSERLSSIGVLPGTGGTIMTSGGPALLLTNMGGNTTFGGQIIGDIDFARTNGNTLTLESAQTYTGRTLMMGGTLGLENDATLLNTSAIDLNYATLSLNNNSSLQTPIYNRIGDSIPITLRSGSLTLNGRISTFATESFGVITAAAGANNISVNIGGGTFSSANATIDSLVRQAGATVNFAGTQLGQQGNTSRIYLTTPPQTFGSGVLGAWAIANNTDYAAYNTALGVGVVGQGGFAGYDPTFASGKITELSATGILPVTTLLPSGGATTGMLRIAGNFSNNVAFTNDSDILNLEMGGLLRSSNIFDTTIGSLTTRGVITAGTPELIVFNNASGSPTFGGATLVANSAVVTMSSTMGLRPGMTVTHANFPAGTTVVSVDSYTQVTLSNPASAAATSQTLGSGSFVSGETVANSAEVTMNSTVGLAPGMTFTGTNIPAGTYILSVDSPTKVTLSQKATASATGLTNFSAGVSNLIINSVIADNGSPLTLVKSGAGVMNLSANNTYTGGTIISQGTVNLIGSGVVLPAGGLTITGAVVNMNTNAGQIAATNDVIMNGSSTLTMAGNNTLASLTFNNNGGTSSPIVNTGGILTLTDSATPITVSSSNPLTTAAIAGFLNLGSGTRSLDVPVILVNGKKVSGIHPTLNISAAIVSPDANLVKTGAGILQLSGQSTFNGLNFTNGGILISGNSTPTTGGSGISSGPLGAGTVTAAAGTTFLVDGTRSIGNDITFAGTPTFDSTANSVWTLNLNGKLSGLSNTPTIHVGNPFLTVALLGQIPNIGSITSFNKTGLGALVFNSTGYTGDFNATALGNPNSISLLNDGDGTASVQTIATGNLIFDPGIVPTVVVGRAGGTLRFGTPVNKILAPASITSLSSGLTVTNNNGYGLQVADAIALSGTPTFTVANATNSNVTQGLYLNGLISGVGFTKAGNGTMVLGNASNSFTGTINITAGSVSVSKDSQLGNAANQISLSAATGTATFRATDNISTARTINFTTTTGTRTIEVTEGKTLELTSPFGVTGNATATLTKNDRGTLILAAANPSWDGSLTVSQGVVRVTDGGALGSTTGRTVISTLVGQVQVSGGITVAEPLDITGVNNQTFGGIDSTGVLRSVSGNNTWSGPIALTTASTADNQYRSATITVDSGSTLNLTGGLSAVLITSGTTRNAWFGLGGDGTGFISGTGITFSGGVANTFMQLGKFGSGTWNLQVANGYTGHQVMVNGGVLSLNGAGSFAAPGTGGASASNTIYVTRNATLELNNAGTNVNNRLGGSRNLEMRGGTLTISGNSTASTTETISGTFVLNPGKAVITLTADPATQLNFTTGPVTRNGGSTALIRGSNLGSAAGNGVATIQATGAGYVFVGQAATSGANKAILPWALVDASTSGLGTSFATANSVNGVLRPLAASEYTDGSIVANNNILLTNTTPALAISTSINSLTLGIGGGVNLGSSPITLTIESGGILAMTGNAGISGGLLSTASNRELIIHAQGDLTISSSLVRFTGGMTKSGAGVLTLTSTSNYYSGTTTLNEGTLKLAGGNNTLFYNNAFTLQNGILDLNGNNQFLGALQTSTLSPTSANLIPNAGGKIINTGANQVTLAVGTGASFAGSIGNGNPAESNIALVRSTPAGGTSDWNPYTPQTYTGPTILNGGRINMLGTSTFSNTSSIEISQATLLISNNNGTSIQDININDRVNDNAPILIRGGMLQPRGRFGEIATETFGDITIGEGTSIIDIATGGTGINEYTVTIGSLERQAGSRGVLRLLNIGGTIGNASQLFITDEPTLVRDMIGGWATLEREFASYSSVTGVGALSTAGYAGYSGKLINDAVAADNIRFAPPTAGATIVLTDDRTMNSLNVNAPASSTGNTTLDLAGKTLTLESGGLILSPITDNFNMTVQNGNITAGLPNVGGDLYLHAMTWVNGQADNTGNRDVFVNANIVDNGTGPVTLVVAGSQGRGTAAATNDVFITGTNTYTGDTYVNSGRIVLNNPLANGTTVTATGTGDLFITGGYGLNAGIFSDRNTQVFLNASHQIANTAKVGLMGGGTLNLNGFTQTVSGVAFNNHGGDSPTLAIGNGTLNLGGDITAKSGNIGSVAVISSTALGKLNLDGATRTLTVDRVTANGQNLAPLVASLNISAIISGTGSEGLIKKGTGLLQLGGQSTFSGGIDLQTGGITIAANSTPTQAGTPLISGPLGTGTLAVSNGALILVDNTSRTVANAITFAGTPIFESTGVSAVTLTLNGLITLPNGAVVVSIPNPNLTVSLLGTITNIGSITSITKSGLGNLNFNTSGYAGDFVVTGSNLLSLFNDGDGTGRVETINLGSATFDAGVVPAITVGRAADDLPLVQAANKIISLSSVSSMANGLTVTANNGYGLRIVGAATLASPTFNVTPATNSNVTQGLYLDGLLSGTGLIKTGPGTLVLRNSGNNFTGLIDIQQGVISVSEDAQLGNSGNIVSLNPSTGTATLRATETFSTARTIRFGNTANTRAIEVTAGNVLTLTSPFDLTGGAAAVLVKNDNGAVELAAANSSWTGGITINAGAVRLTNGAGAGTGTIVVAPAVTGAALQLVGGVTVNNPLSLQPTTNVLLGGLNFGGQLQSVSGVNTYTGLITLGFDSAIGADAGSTLNITGGINHNAASPHQVVFTGGGNINISGTSFTASGGAATGIFGLQKFGNGVLTISNANTVALTDATGFRVNGGTVVFKGAGTWTGSFTNSTSNFVLNPGGTLTLDNSAAAGGNVNNRLGTSRAIAFAGGRFNLIGNESANTTETFGVPTFSRGLSIITVTAQDGFQSNLLFTGSANNPSTAQNSSTTPTGASILFRGTNLGSAAGAGVATIRDSGAAGFSFAGQTGATGTPNKAIMPYALIDTSATGNGISFATGDAAASAAFTTANLRPLAANEYATVNTVSASNNINLNSGLIVVTATTNINSLTMADNVGLALDPFRSLTSSSGGILVKSGSSTISGGIISQINTSAPLNVWTVGNLTISSFIHGGNGTANGNIGFVKAGAGTLTLSTPTSLLSWLPGYGANSSSGQFVLNQGKVVLNGGQNTIQANNFVALENGILDLNGNSQMVNGLFTTGATAGAGGIITSALPATLVNNADNSARNFAGSIQGDIYFNRSGQNTMTYYSPHTYTGGTLINGGTTLLRDSSTLSNTSSIEINYATLSFDNNVGTMNLTDRVNDAAPISMRGATLTVQGRAQTASSEALGAISLIQGFNVINPLLGGTGVNSMDLSIASLSRPAGSSATLIVQGTNLGTIGNNSRVTVGTLNGIPTNSSTFSSNGGGLTNNIVGGWAENGNDFLTYTPLGFAALGQVGAPQYDYVNVIPAGDFATRNVRLTATTSIPNGGTTVNALSMSGSNIALNFATATDTLNLTSGGLIGPNNNQTIGATLDSGRLTAGGLTPGMASDLYVFNRTNTLTINSRIIDNPNGGTSSVRVVFTASGGAITLVNGANSYTGGTVVNGGTLNLSNTVAGSVLGTGNLELNGAVVTMHNSSGQISPDAVATLHGSSTLNFYGNNSIKGLVFNNTGGTAPTVGQTTAATAGSGANGVLTIGSGGVVASSSNVGSTSILIGRMDFGTTPNTITVNPIMVNGVAVAPLLPSLDLRGMVGSSGGVTKLGNGVLQLASQQVSTGPFIVAEGGVRLGNGNAGSRFSAYTINAGARIDLNSQATTLGSIEGEGTIFNSGNANTLTVGFNNNSTTFSGQIARFNDAIMNAVGLQKIGTGILTMASAQNFATGSTGAITINGGGITYSGAGKAFTGTAASGGGTFNVNTGGTLTVDNSATSGSNVNHRLGLDVAGTLLLQGGSLVVQGNGNDSTHTTERITTLDFSNGTGTITLNAHAGSQLNLTIGTLANEDGTGTGLIRGINGTAAAAGNATFAITTITLLGGQGGGANGTPTMSVRRDILGDISTTGLGTGFLVKDSATNLYRPLGGASPFTSGELQMNPASWATTQNAGVNSAVSNSINRSSNTLTMGGTSSLNSSLDASAFGLYSQAGALLGHSLNINALLVLDGGAASVNLGSLNGTAGTAWAIHTVGSSVLNVNGYFGFGNTGGLAKAGNGTLNFNKPTLFTGAVAVNNGTLNLNSGADNTLVVVPGTTTPVVPSLNISGLSAVVDLKGYSQAVAGLTSANPLPGHGGTVTNTGLTPATFTSTGGGTYSGVIAGNLGFTRAGNNTTLLTNANTYTGVTIVRGGVLQLRDSGSILNSSAINLHFGTLNVDQFGLNALGNLNPTRIAASTPVTMQGAVLTLTGSGSVDSALTLNSLTVTGGGNTINVLPPQFTGGTAKLTINNLVRASNQSVVNFNGFAGSSSSLGGQGMSLNANVILDQINGVPFSSANLTNGLIGGWAVADGSTFATYVDGRGVSVMGQTTQGIVAPGFTGNDLSAATVATGNYSDSANGSGARTISGAHEANSWRLAGQTGTSNFTLATNTPITLGVGIITNANVALNFVGTDATSTITTATPGSDLYVYVNQSTTSIGAKLIGNMNLVKAGGATLALNNSAAVGSNTFTGGTFVQQGTLNLNAGAVNTVLIPGDLTINNGAVTMNATVPGQIAATSNVTINGGGSLTLANYSTGPTQTLASITFNNTGGAANPTLSLGTPTAATSTLVISGANAVTATNDSFATTPVISTGAATLTALQFSSANPVITTSGLSPMSLLISAPITQNAGMTGPITKSGPGSLSLSGANTFTTGFRLDQGTLIFGASSAGTVPTITNGPVGTGTLTIGDGTTLLSDTAVRTIGNATVVNGDFTIGGMIAGNGLTLSGAMNLGAAGRTVTINSPAVTLTVSGAIVSTSGDTALTKAGNGTLILSSSANNFNGAGVSVTGGILKNGVNNAIPTGSAVKVSAGAGYDLANFDQALLGIEGTGFITNSANAAKTLTVGGASGSSAFAGILTDNNIAQSSSRLNLTKVGNGTLSLTHAGSDYSGVTTVNGGVLEVAMLTNGGVASSIGDSSSAATNLIINNATFRYTGSGDATDRSFTIGTAGAAIEASGSGPVIFTSATAPTLAGTNTARTFTLGGTNAGDNTFAAAIGDNGTGATSLLKNGSGTWVLSAAQIYSGTTTLADGRLQVNGLTGTGAVSVLKAGVSLASAPTLMGSGTIAGATTIGNPLLATEVGVLSPGNGIANNQMLNFSHASGLTVASGSQVQLTITAPTITAEASLIAAISSGSYTNLADYLSTYFTANSSYPAWIEDTPGSTGSDLHHDYVSTTSLSLGSRTSSDFGQGTVLVIDNGYTNAQLGDVFHLLDWVGAMQGNFSTGASHFGNGGSFGDLDMPALPAGLTWDVSAFQGFGIATVVPEPSRALLLFLGIFGLFFRRRRR